MQRTYTLSGNVITAQATPRMQGTFKQPVTFTSKQLAQLLGYESTVTPASQSIYFSGTPSAGSSNMQSLLSTIDEDTFLSLAKNIQGSNSGSNVSDNPPPTVATSSETTTKETENATSSNV